MKTILVPTDLSTHAETALIYAAGLAHELQADRLVYVHVSESDPILPKEADLPDSEIQNYLQNQLNEVLNAPLFGQSKVEGLVWVKANSPALNGILEAAEEFHPDLIVVGTHGNTGLEKLVFGSVTLDLLEKSPYPVLAIPRNFVFKKVHKVYWASSLSDFEEKLLHIMSYTGSWDLLLQIIHFDFQGTTDARVRRAHKKLEELGVAKGMLEVISMTEEIPLVDAFNRRLREASQDWVAFIRKKTDGYTRPLLPLKWMQMAMHLQNPMLMLPALNEK